MNLVCDFPSALNIRFCDSLEMQQTNLMFRGKDKVTDVLSFPSVPGTQEQSAGSKVLYALGDLLVCVAVCRKQAKQHRLSLSQEIEKMIVHGLVHLRGFDHERGDASWRTMSVLEKALVKELKSAHGEPNWAQDTLRSVQ